MSRLDKLEDMAATKQDIRETREHFDKHIVRLKADMRHVNDKMDKMLFHFMEEKK